MSEETFDDVSELKHMPDDIVRHFVQNGLCVGCNTPANGHQAISDRDMNPEWTICWTETGANAYGPWATHFCVRTEDHPNHITLNEFEELYS